MTHIFIFQVVDIMRVNVDKVLERDQKLSELDDRAGMCTGTPHITSTINSTFINRTLWLSILQVCRARHALPSKYDRGVISDH